MPGISFPRVTTGHSQGPVPPAGAGFLLLSKMGIVPQLGTTAVLTTGVLGRGWELGVRQGRVPAAPLRSFSPRCARPGPRFAGCQLALGDT